SPPLEYRKKLCTIILQNFAEILLKHFNTFAYEEAAAVYGTMQKLLANTKMSMPPTIQKTIQAAILWLTETQHHNELQKIFDKCVLEMNDALDAENPAPVLEQIHYALLTAATQADTTIPGHIEERYQSQIEDYELQRSRRIKIIVSAVTCACIFLCCMILWGLTIRNFNNTVTETLVSLQQIESEKRYEDIPGTIQQIEIQHQSIIKNPQIVAAFERLGNLYDEDKKRSDEFERYYSQAMKTLDNTPELDQNTAEQIKLSIEQTEKLMRTLSEKSQFSELKHRYDSASFTLKTKQNTEYNENIDTISKEFNDLRENTDRTSDEIILNLTKLSSQINALQQQYPDASDTLKKQSDFLLESVSKYETKIKSELEQNETFENLVNKIPKLTDYKNALQYFATKFPQHPVVTDAEEVLNELDNIQLVVGVLHNLKMSYLANAHDINKLHENAAEILTTIDDLASKISGSPDELFPPTQYLRVLSEMKPYTQDTFKLTKTFLHDLTQKKVWRWIQKDNWYYLTKKTEKTGNYSYITDFLSKDNLLKIHESEFKPENVPNNTQSDFSLNALEKLDNINNNAVEVVCDLIEELLKPNEFDPIMKVILLDSFITDISSIDPIFETNFKRCSEIIATSSVDKGTNWMNVDLKNTVSQRNLANTVLNRMPSIDELIKKTKNEHNKFNNLIGQFNLEFECVGILTQKDKKWHCNVKSSLTDKNGTLYILRQTPNNIIAPIPIGSNSETGIQLTGNENSYLQCLPVFLKR
ncbi:MAG: hypothetical protein LBK82_15640, partial [Planctomycetaceae bacterium]|nr:hypothetical protein [Planctomycetaceae bacterium]